MSSSVGELSRKMKNFHPPTNLRKLYLSESTADVHFVFAKESTGVVRRVPAHKCILAIASVVFHRMFYGELKEDGEVQIVDVSADGFSEFLQFFYLEEVQLSGDNLAEVITLADKYDVPGCMHLCEQFLDITLTLDSVCWCYELATLFHLQYLVDTCEERLCKESKSIFESESFVHCTRQILARILGLERLSCDEIDILHACMRWATEACKRSQLAVTVANQREQLAECFHLIRFPAMSSEDFSKCLADYDELFSAAEMLDILSYLTLHRELRVATQFSVKPRHGTPAWTKDDTICICDRRTLPNLCRSAPVTRDAVVFTVNERILLGQIAISVFKMESIEKETITEYRPGILNVYRLNGANGNGGGGRRNLLTQTVQLSSSSHTKIELLKPIIVQPFEDYVIETQWELESGDLLVLRTECKSEIMVDGGVRFQFKRDDDLEYDNVTEGLVSRLYFKKW